MNVKMVHRMVTYIISFALLPPVASTAFVDSPASLVYRYRILGRSNFVSPFPYPSISSSLSLSDNFKINEPSLRIPQSEKIHHMYSSEWVVPKKIEIPSENLKITFVKSSGPGGQNVNKVNTQVNLRFHVMTAHWIPFEVRERLKQNEKNRINKEGIMGLASQQYRTQAQNKKDVLKKLEIIILKSYSRPQRRKMDTRISRRMKEKKKTNKNRTSILKSNRKRIVDY